MPAPPTVVPAGRYSLAGRVAAFGRPVPGAHIALLGCGKTLELRSEAGSFHFDELASSESCRLRVTDPPTGHTREETVEAGTSVVVHLR